MERKKSVSLEFHAQQTYLLKTKANEDFFPSDTKAERIHHQQTRLQIC